MSLSDLASLGSLIGATKSWRSGFGAIVTVLCLGSLGAEAKSDAPVELWNGVVEGMTVDQVLTTVPGSHSVEDESGVPYHGGIVHEFVAARTNVNGHPALAHVGFGGDAATVVRIEIIVRANEESQNEALVRELAKSIGERYKESGVFPDNGGSIYNQLWDVGQLQISLFYVPGAGGPPICQLFYAPRRSD